MIPVYLADKELLKQAVAYVYDDFQGNWIGNSVRTRVPVFFAVGADHALEHINRCMKVADGLVGITLNARARTQFFLISQ